MAITKQSSGQLTLPELVEALPLVLGGGYDGVRNGRVRELPDSRTIRWYQTLGMVDRPASFRGRTAFYGRRHLLQLAAIKQLQSSGFSLTEIQRGLAGSNDVELSRSARVAQKDVDRVIEHAVLARSTASAAKLAVALAGQQQSPRRNSEFWKAQPAIAATPASPPLPSSSMRSATLGDVGMLLWNGRDLTSAEQATLAQLAGPLVRFLSSVAAHPASRPPVSPSRKASSRKKPAQEAAHDSHSHD